MTLFTITQPRQNKQISSNNRSSKTKTNTPKDKANQRIF